MPAHPFETRSINNFLGNRGLATLDDPKALFEQLGFLIETEQEFRGLLDKCEPEGRRAMYDALTPHFRFPVKPLDVYIAELGAEAYARQLPTWEDGKMKPFEPIELKTREHSDAYLIEKAVLESQPHKKLWLVCRKCTREEVFTGEHKGACISAARTAGWTWDELKGDGREICPTCDVPEPAQQGRVFARNKTTGEVIEILMPKKGLN